MVRQVLVLGLLAGPAVLGGCSSRDPTGATSPALRVVRVSPGPTGEDGRAVLFLNQDILIDFNAPIVPSSINQDTVYVLDASGRRVAGRAQRTGKSTVTFKPVPPLTADYRDGSFRPGERYRLVVVGFPKSNAVMSAGGERLLSTATAEFRAVSNPPRVKGFEYPLLAVDPDQPFALASDVTHSISDRSGILRLYFTLPVLPPSLTPDAISVQRVRRASYERLTPTGWWIEGESDHYARHYGSVVALRFDPAEVRPTDKIFVLLQGSTLRDYMGRAVQVGHAMVKIGDDATLLTGSFDRTTEFIRGGRGVSFVGDRSGAVPKVWTESGDGLLGAFRPERDTEIPIGRQFFLTPEVYASATPELAFQSLTIPAGVTVTLRSDVPVIVRVLDDVRIDGTLLLDGTLTPVVEWSEYAQVERGLMSGGFAMFAGGDLRIGSTGSIRHSNERALEDQSAGRRSAATLICAGELQIRGHVPMNTVLPADQLNDVVAEQPFLIDPFLTRGPPIGQSMVQAEAWTDWYELPERFSGEVDVQGIEVSKNLTVEVEFATRDTIHTDAPRAGPGLHLSALTATVPSAPGQPERRIGLQRPRRVPEGTLIRLRLSALVRQGDPLPRIRGFQVVRR